MPPRENDLRIGDDTVLWRAISPPQVCRDDEGKERAESWAFLSDDNEVSAWVAQETDIRQLGARFPGFRIAEFTAGQARECRNVIARDPVEGDSSHVVVCPLTGKSSSQIRKDARRLAEKARLLP